MYSSSLLLSFLLIVTSVRCDEWCSLGSCMPQYPIGDLRYCPTQSPQNASQTLHLMEVLPGVGFDSLRNLDMGEVHYYNYSTCKISKNGQYLLPDNIFLLPVQESHVDTFAEFFAHWDNYTSMTAASMNLDFTDNLYSKVSGKFSAGYMATKSHQVNSKSMTTRVQIRHRLYTVKIQPDAQLNPTFKARLFDIAANLQNNNTEFAEYLAELLVRDYGTHYVTTVEAGALLAQVDQISSEYVENEDYRMTTITASASADFFDKISLGAGFSYSTTSEDKNAFIQSRSHSEIYTLGGPRFRPNLTIAEWEAGVPDALVALDRSGDPLNFVINPSTLAELPEMTVRQVSAIVYGAINRYYKVNTRHGCTRLDSPNFNFQANLDDGSCNAVATNFTFGGVFQTCEIDYYLSVENLCNGGPEPAAQVNPLTGGYSCPEGYTAVKLHSGTITHVTQRPVCHWDCHHCGIWGWKRCCHCQTVLAPFFSSANYHAYWCAAMGEVPENSGYLFGGFYTSTASNPFTGAMTCPRYYIPVHFGEDIQVCVSSDYELGYPSSIPFAGFESCVVGNPLAASKSSRSDPNKWPHGCPHGYAQHLVTVDEGCEIDFCVKAGSFDTQGLIPAKLPPYRKFPRYKKNVTDTLVVFGVYGEIWVKEQDGRWTLKNTGLADGAGLLENFETPPDETAPGAIVDGNITTGTDGLSESASQNDHSSLSNGAVAAISVFSTLALGTLIVMAVFAGYWCARKKGKKDGPKADVRYSASSPEEEMPIITSNESTT